jgi:hypothetical protein
MGRVIESRQGIPRVVAFKKYIILYLSSLHILADPIVDLRGVLNGHQVLAACKRIRCFVKSKMPNDKVSNCLDQN